MKVIFSIILLHILCLQTAAAQDTLPPVLSFEDFQKQVRNYHPLARRTALLTDEAKAALLAASGNFDPKIVGTTERKSFDGKNYYTLASGGLKFPAWYGAEFKATYDYASGVFLNPENKLPAGGQAVLGFTIPLLQGLMIDERRASLFQARILRNANEAEQRALLNDLLFESAKAYWEWALAAANRKILADATDVAQKRFEVVRETYLQGDAPAIDTLEALIQLQNRQMEQNDAELIFRNATYKVNSFLWNTESTEVLDSFYALPDSVTDVPTLFENMSGSVQQQALSHPTVQNYQFQLAALEVERRLKKEKLKPQLDFSYNFLADGFDFSRAGASGNDFINNIILQNYKWGLEVGFPIFLRKDRAGLQLTKLKIMATDFELSNKRQEIDLKIFQYQNELQNLRRQLQTANEITGNYARLLDAETEKFAIGESSLFLINARENKLLEAQFKLAKLKAEQRKTEAALRWATGRLN
ncbi:MAG TPA: TolC family protein [Saprospiraceae bacterium]|nr:TolC family protein [Saprospiraceae bacterium]